MTGAERGGVFMKVSAWPAWPVAIGLAAALTACSSPAGTVAAAATRTPASAESSSPVSVSSGSFTKSPSAAATSVPAGYQRVGGPTQGVSFAVPDSWTAINLAKESVQQAARRIGLRGVSAAQLVQDVESLQKLHGIIVIDATSAADSPMHFATTFNAYCSDSGLNEAGGASLPLVRQEAAADFAQLHAGHIAQKDMQVGGVPGVQTSYTLSSSGSGTLQGAQFEVLPRADRACYLTLTSAQGKLPAAIMGVVAATAVFS